MKRKILVATSLIVATAALVVGCGSGANSQAQLTTNPPAAPSGLATTISASAAAVSNVVTGTYYGMLESSDQTTLNQPFTLVVDTMQYQGQKVFRLTFNSSGTQNYSFSKAAFYAIGSLNGSPSGSEVLLLPATTISSTDSYLSEIEYSSLNNGNPINILVNIALSNDTTFDPSRSAITLLDCGSSQASCLKVTSKADIFAALDTTGANLGRR